MWSGLSAFPLTPIGREGVDAAAFAALVDRLVAAGVDSIGALGSTGSYLYLSREKRARGAALAIIWARREAPVPATNQRGTIPLRG